MLHHADSCGDYTTPALELSIPEVSLTFSTNLFAIMDINTVFSPLIRQAHGTFVHTGSVAGIIPYVWGSAYNASKAALQAYCSTLRVEMEPFGVHVINVITGGVKSNIARTERNLASDSWFTPIKESFARRLKHSQEVGMDTTVYARDVVSQVLGARGWLVKRGEIWAGSNATRIWFAQWIELYWPWGIFGFVMRRTFGLDRLRK